MTYYLKLEGKILDALYKADININNLKEKFKKNLIPISILEKACKSNLNDKFCSVYLQYVWFCLDNEYVYRKFHTGWKRFRVSFSDVYVENSRKNRKIILASYTSCSRPKSKIFSKMCGKHYVSIREYISGKNKIPLSTFIKSCQLLNKDPWRLLDDSKIYSGSSIRSKFIIFNNKITPELYILLNWINLEGNISIDRPSVSISQNIHERLCLQNLTKQFKEVFNISNELIKIYKFNSRPNILYLIINSAPLRQILNLRYKIPLGYKSRIVKPNPSFNFNKEDTLRILASEIETEGSFVKHRKKKIIHCEVSFSTYSEIYSKSVFDKLRELEYPVNFCISKRKEGRIDEIEYRSSFWRVFDIQKFAFEIMPYFYHLNKIKNLLDIIRQSNYLKITRVNFDDNIKELIYDAKSKCGNFKLLTKKLNEEDIDISHKAVEAWVYQFNCVSVYSILKMCSIIGERDYFKYLPRELAFTLWVNGFIDRKKAEDLRGIKNAYKHIEPLINRDRLSP